MQMCERPDLYFEDKTYVAFCDLCGFRELMKTREQAYEALDHLFQSVYDLLDNISGNIKALAVSDCVIAWATDSHLQTIVEFVSRLHKKMIEKNYLMKTSVAYGDFKYEKRIELRDLGKSMIWGGAYLDAYLGNNKAKAGSIILLKNDNEHSNPTCFQDEMWRWKKRKAGWEYYWAAVSERDIKAIDKARAQKYKALKDKLRNLACKET